MVPDVFPTTTPFFHRAPDVDGPARVHPRVEQRCIERLGRHGRVVLQEFLAARPLLRDVAEQVHRDAGAVDDGGCF